MAAPDWPFVAVKVIYFNGVRAFNPGDPVPVSAVEGPDAWLVLDEDVKQADVKPAEVVKAPDVARKPKAPVS